MSVPRAPLLTAALLAVLAGCVAPAGPAATLASPATARFAASAVDSVSAHRAAEGFLAAFDSLQFEPFRAYLAEEVTMFFPFPQFTARVDGRARVEEIFGQFITAQREARTRAGRPLVQGLEPRDLRLQMAGPDVAVVSFHLGAESRSRRSIVFHRDGGAWRVIHWHASSAPAPAGG
ncbi:MAG TPA: nuclear transport factor 2 family protein [Longimicrobiaceae bacterium]|nr:nuclear transport factor 2 family protein [Longimicrobiaceae bacterium]